MVHLDVSLWTILKLGIKVANHRYLQYRLCTNETVIIKTNAGTCRGIKRKTIYDKFYYSFEGIPYAEPPLGEMRFRSPKPLKPWEGVRDCTHYGSAPMQKHFLIHKSVGSEDCLYLNIYVKKLRCPDPLPVMVWIYGGAFQIGEASRDLYSPDYFMEKDIVLVTFNYRLGALGFLSLNDPDVQVPGNAGLKDQLLALRWVKDNISRFNGDVNNITLFGESAGAASVHALMLTDKTKGLFHKAILQSGTVLAPWLNPPQHDWGYRLATKLGYIGNNNDKQVYDFLSKVESSKIVQYDCTLLTKQEQRDRVMFSFSPIIEPYTCADSLLTRPFQELMSTTWTNSIPLIIGYNSCEGLLGYPSTLSNPWLLNEFGDGSEMLPPEVKASCNSPEELRELGLRIKNLHFGDKQPSVQNSLMEYLELFACGSFWHCAHRVLLSRLAYEPNASTYLYRFDVDSPFFNHFRVLACGRSIRGVSHADDLSYIWFNANGNKLPPDAMEYKAIHQMINMWTSFASNSDPNCEEIEPAKWESAVIKEDCVCLNKPWKCLNISKELQFIELPEWEKLLCWDTLFTKSKLY